MAEFVYTGMNDADLVRWARQNKRPDKALLVSGKVYEKKRTIDQNAQSFVWYKQLANQLDSHDVRGWRNYCKLNLGIPILVGSDAEFAEFYDKALSHLTYEQREKAMDYVPVTRLMKTAQFNQYFDAMKAHFMPVGVHLTFLNEPRFEVAA